MREKYLDCLVNNLESRFQNSSVLSAFTLFNPKGATKAKKKSDAEFNTHGKSHLDAFAKHFSTIKARPKKLSSLDNGTDRTLQMIFCNAV